MLAYQVIFNYTFEISRVHLRSTISLCLSFLTRRKCGMARSLIRWSFVKWEALFSTARSRLGWSPVDPATANFQLAPLTTYRMKCCWCGYIDTVATESSKVALGGTSCGLWVAFHEHATHIIKPESASSKTNFSCIAPLWWGREDNFESNFEKGV